MAFVSKTGWRSTLAEELALGRAIAKRLQEDIRVVNLANDDVL